MGVQFVNGHIYETKKIQTSSKPHSTWSDCPEDTLSKPVLE